MRRLLASVLVVLGVVLGVGLVGSSPAFAFDVTDPCGDSDELPPVPELPNTGVLAAMDGPTRTVDGAEVRRGEPGSPYHDYRYAGTTWHVYNIDCAFLTPDTSIGNALLGFAKGIVGVSNWAHYSLSPGSTFLAPLDGIVDTGAQASYDVIFLPFIGLALTIVAVLILLWVRKGDMSRQASQFAYALAALTAAGAVVVAPAAWAGGADRLLYDTTAGLKTGFLPGSTADTLPTLMYERVVFESWYLGELPDKNPANDALAAVLLRGQAFAVDEVTGDDARMRELAALKACDYYAVAQATRTDMTDVNVEPFTACSAELAIGDALDSVPFVGNPVTDQNTGAQTQFAGTAGSRVVEGLFAVVKALVICLFQLAAAFTVLVALMVVRLIVIGLPIAAVIGVVHNQYLVTLVRLVGTALVNALLLAALAGIHAMVLSLLLDLDNGIYPFFALILSLVVTVVLWKVATPIGRVNDLMRMVGSQALGGNRLSWFMSRGREQVVESPPTAATPTATAGSTGDTVGDRVRATIVRRDPNGDRGGEPGRGAAEDPANEPPAGRPSTVVAVAGRANPQVGPALGAAATTRNGRTGSQRPPSASPRAPMAAVPAGAADRPAVAALPSGVTGAAERAGAPPRRGVGTASRQVRTTGGVSMGRPEGLALRSASELPAGRTTVNGTVVRGGSA